MLGPSHVLHYLARYTHRVAISNHRLIAVTEDEVTFRWKDYRHGSAVRLTTLSAEEFLRRFCLHVLPKGFVRIRFYGFLAPRCRTEALPRCRHALGVTPPQVPAAWTRSDGAPAPALRGLSIGLSDSNGQPLRCGDSEEWRYAALSRRTGGRHRSARE